MCLLCFYCFSELLEADLGDFEVMSRTRESQFSLVRDITRSINIVAWPMYQRWKVSAKINEEGEIISYIGERGSRYL